jgi:hypothetical protein
MQVTGRPSYAGAPHLDFRRAGRAAEEAASSATVAANRSSQEKILSEQVRKPVRLPIPRAGCGPELPPSAARGSQETVTGGWLARIG